ncbi:MAG: hypothetical protein MRZ17_04880 [Acholeplasmataceae bacterium]|nr:hypothetical protein [Acholeplasmataceae bacterium]
MKIIFAFLFTFLISLGTLQEKVDNFNTSCSNAYELYLVDKEIDNDLMYLNITLGIYDNQAGYSICFLSGDAGRYTARIKVHVSDNTYKLPQDDRGDSLLYFVVADTASTLQIYLGETCIASYDLPQVSVDSLRLNENLKSGNNQGFTEWGLSHQKTPKLTFILSIVFSCIIVLSIVVILVLALTKKGIFNKANRIEQAKTGMNYSTMNNEVEVVEETTITPSAPEEPKANADTHEEPKEVYKKIHDYENDGRDVSQILMNKGFNVNYKELSMEDKNKVMLELMRMKDFKEITNDEYRSEVIKLWS